VILLFQVATFSSVSPEVFAVESYYDDILQFSIVPPENWESSTVGNFADNRIVVFTGPYYENEKFFPVMVVTNMQYFSIPDDGYDVKVFEDEMTKKLLSAILSPNPNVDLFSKNIEFQYFDDKIQVILSGFAETNFDNSKKSLKFESIIWITNSLGTYSLTFAAPEEIFDNLVSEFRKSAETFVLKEPEITIVVEKISEPEVIKQGEEGGGCLIATATYGTELAPQVQLLREWRDNVLLETHVGTSFISSFNQFYYSFSPAIADYERENPAFKQVVKITITPLLYSFSILDLVSIDSDEEVIGWGAAIIIFNSMLYFGMPLFVINKLRLRMSNKIHHSISKRYFSRNNSIIKKGPKFLIIILIVFILLNVPTQNSYSHYDITLERGPPPVNLQVFVTDIFLAEHYDYLDQEILLAWEVNHYNHPSDGKVVNARLFDDLQRGHNYMKHKIYDNSFCQSPKNNLEINFGAYEDDSLNPVAFWTLTIVGGVATLVGGGIAIAAFLGFATATAGVVGGTVSVISTSTLLATLGETFETNDFVGQSNIHIIKNEAFAINFDLDEDEMQPRGQSKSDEDGRFSRVYEKNLRLYSEDVTDFNKASYIAFQTVYQEERIDKEICVVNPNEISTHDITVKNKQITPYDFSYLLNWDFVYSEGEENEQPIGKASVEIIREENENRFG